MPTLQTSTLAGAALDWAVAMAEGRDDIRIISQFGPPAVTLTGNFNVHRPEAALFKPSAWWRDGGPIIESNDWALPRININPGALHLGRYAASDSAGFDYFGATPLTAAMRAYVSHKLGPTVDAPDELVPPTQLDDIAALIGSRPCTPERASLILERRKQRKGL